MSPSFSPAVLEIDRRKTIRDIADWIRETIHRDLRRRGVVVGLSGGIDSSVCAALSVEALGRDHVLGLFTPELDSSPETNELGNLIARHLGIQAERCDIGSALDAMGCYDDRVDAIRDVIPEYGPGWKSKIVLPPLNDRGRLNIFRLVAQSPQGETHEARLPLGAYLRLVAATNMKQRTRKLIEYYHAERRNYAVVGTPNRLEFDQGFFVKYGDGAADLKPIAHLYKTQVYALAEELGVPEAIRRRPPTTDTYSMPQTQEEFYFALPYDKMDLCLWAHNHGIPAAEVAPVVQLDAAQVESVYRDIESKRRATRYLHLTPRLAEEVGEILAD
jgi:NAD+ synthase